MNHPDGQERYDYGDNPCSVCATGWMPGECLDPNCTATYNDYNDGEGEGVSLFAPPYQPPSKDENA